MDCQGPQGEDLSGGFYEAGGSYLKFSFPTAYTLTQLAWGVIEFKDGYVKVLAPCTWHSCCMTLPGADRAVLLGRGCSDTACTLSSPAKWAISYA